jgi:hypothetical protein
MGDRGWGQGVGGWRLKVGGERLDAGGGGRGCRFDSYQLTYAFLFHISCFMLHISKIYQE